MKILMLHGINHNMFVLRAGMSVVTTKLVA